MTENVLTVSCSRPVGESGTVTILAPTNYAPANYDGLHVSRLGETDKPVISKHISFDIPTVNVVIPFNRLDKKDHEKDVGDER